MTDGNDLITMFLKIGMPSVQQQLLKASSLASSGDIIAARGIYSDILATYPRNSSARKALRKLDDRVNALPVQVMQAITVAYEAQDWPCVLRDCQTHIRSFPMAEPLWTYCGAAALQMGGHDTAIVAFLKAAELRRSGTTLRNLAGAFAASGLHDRALETYAEAAKAEPGNAAHVYAMAQAHLALGQVEQAAQTARRYCDLVPQDAQGFALVGEAELMAGRPEPALHAFDAAVQRAPDTAAFHTNAGVAARMLGDLDGAEAALTRALALAPENASAHQNLANVHYDRGALDAAIDSYGQALAHDGTKQAALAQKLHLQLRQCDWSVFDAFAPTAARFGIEGEPISPFVALALEDDPMRQRLRSAHFARGLSGRRAARPVPAAGRIRIGYFSSDFYAHATLQLLNGVLDHHDREAFEIHAYSLNPPSPSEEAARMMRAVDHHHPCHGLTDAQIVALARSHDLAIAVDLKGYTEGARSQIFAEGVGAIQVSYLGYPGTLGGDSMDYLIADRVVIPPDLRDAYSEALVYLPHSYQPNDNLLPIAKDAGTRADHGLPDGAQVLCAFNQSYKISPDEFAIWMRLLARHPQAILWLMEPGPQARQRLADHAAAAGVDPARLIYAGRLPGPAHRARHRHADLFVDTFRVNAHTTASDALWAGLPVVTLPGQQFAARVAASLLCAVDLPDLIAETPEQYEAIISDLLDRPEDLAALTNRLQSNIATAPLFDTRSYTRHLEAAFRAMVQTARAGQEPADMTINPDGSVVPS